MVSRVIILLFILVTACSYTEPTRSLTKFPDDTNVLLDKDPEHLEPITKALFYSLESLARDAGITFVVLCTYRSQAEQDEIYKKGRTKSGGVVTEVTVSKHTSGQAFDVGSNDLNKLGQLAESIGLIWGGNANVETLKDMVHFETP